MLPTRIESHLTRFLLTTVPSDSGDLLFLPPGTRQRQRQHAHSEGEEKRVSGGAGDTLQVLGRSKAHRHNLLADTVIPAEIGRMVSSRRRAQHPGVTRIPFCQSLAPLLDSAHGTPDRQG